MSTYNPRGLAAAALDHLRSLPPGSVVSSATLADAIGVSPPSQLSSILGYPVAHGLIIKTKDPENQNRNRWALGDGTPPSAAAEEDEFDTDPPVHRVVPMHDWRAQLSAAMAKKRDRAAPASARQLRIALFSDGALVIHRGEEVLSFDQAETRQICQYLGTALKPAQGTTGAAA